MEAPDGLLYSHADLWVRVAGEIVTLGVTDFAQDQLGEVVYLELPEPAATVRAGEPFGVIESVKAVSDLEAPVSGEVTAVNVALVDAPERVNEAPYGEGWMIELRLSDRGELEGLLDAGEYLARHPAE